MLPETAVRAATLSLTALDEVVARCHRFEADWRAGRQPKVKDYLGGVEGPEGLDLLRRLIGIEAELGRSGDPVSTVAEALSRFPDGPEIAATEVAETIETKARVGCEETVVGDGGGGPGAQTGRASQRHRFRTIRPHRSGGLGAVFVAHDEELGRPVALKEIQSRFADDPSTRARFIREAEITGRLEHPGIVPVYSMGVGDDGRPYYAMRFIGDAADGGGVDRRLVDAIRAFHAANTGKTRETRFRTLEFRELIQRFIAACDAIAYAHSRRVIHRDIKPANILLGPFGETLVVDWGLAKPLDRADPGETDVRQEAPVWGGDSDLTVDDTVAGTPPYMSPEQAVGNLAGIGTWSDIYSLGATLYEILCGRPPYTGTDPRVILAQVIKGDCQPPGEHCPGVPSALEAICRKAMSPEPRDRYETPKALADDLKLWLADEPVSAHRDPIPTRLSRWGRRRRTFVASTAALLATASVASVLGTLAIAKERKQVVATNKALAASNAQLQRETEIVKAAREQSESNFRLARTAVNRTLTQIASGDLATVPQSEGLRKQLAQDAMAFNELFLRQAPTDPKVRAEAAANSREVGNIHRLLGESDAAVKAYNRAVELVAGLTREFPEETTRHAELALIHLDAGELLRLGGRPRDAERHYFQAVGVTGYLLAREPESVMHRRVQARGHYSQAEVAIDTGRFAEAVGLYDEAIAFFDHQAKGPSPGPTDALELAMIRAEHAEALRGVGRHRDALASIEASLAAVRKMLADVPDDNNLQYIRANGLLEQGRTLATDPAQGAAAEKALTDSADALQRLTKQFPKVPDYQLLLAQAIGSRCLARRSAGDRVEATRAARSAVDLLDPLVGQFPDNADFHGALGQALVRLCQLTPEREVADGHAEKARRHLEIAHDANPEGPDHCEALEWCKSQRQSRNDLPAGTHAVIPGN